MDTYIHKKESKKKCLNNHQYLYNIIFEDYYCAIRSKSVPLQCF